MRDELRRHIYRGGRPPRAVNDNRRLGAGRGWYWVLMIGAMPTIGLLAVLSILS